MEANIQSQIEKINLFQYLTDQGLNFSVSLDGNEYVAECHNCFRKKLYIAATGNKKGLWVCFKCNKSGNLFNLMSELEDITVAQAFNRVVKNKTFLPQESLLFLNESIDEMKLEIPKEVELPINFVSLLAAPENNPGKRYATQRGLTQEDIIQFDLQYSPSDQRLIFPVYFNKKVVGWQGRDVSGRSDIDKHYPKAMTGPSKKTGVGFKKSLVFYNFDNVKNAKFCTLVEGPVDCIKGKHVNSMALFGKNISDTQFKLLISMKNLKVIFIALDADAQNERDSTAARLIPFYDVRMVEMPLDRDFGNSNKDEIMQWCKEAKPFKNKLQLL